MRFLYKWVPYLFAVHLAWKFRDTFWIIVNVWNIGTAPEALRDMMVNRPSEWREFVGELNAQQAYEGKKVYGDAEIMELMQRATQ